jgi:hypothetical protein
MFGDVMGEVLEEFAEAQQRVPLRFLTAGMRRRGEPEAELAKLKAWARDNPERARASVRAWQHANRARCTEMKRLWRARQKALGDAAAE